MGYDLHITRKAEWSNTEGPIINEEEFRQIVSSDPELKINEADSTEGWVVAEWNGTMGTMAWNDGEIVSKNPSPEWVAKMAQLAVRLGAKAVGDDGEVYSPAINADTVNVPPAVPLSAPSVFTAKPGTATNSRHQLFIGLVLCLWVPVGFVISVTRVSNGMLILHLITTLPAVIAVGFLRAYAATRKTPAAVAVSQTGITVTYASGSIRDMNWSEIGWTLVDMIPHTKTRRLFVFDTRGQKVLDIVDTVSDFDLLIEQVKDGIARKSDQAVVQSVQSIKARKSAYLALTMGIVFTLLAAAFTWYYLHEDRDRRMLDRHGVPIQATVTRMQMAPDGITPRLYYTFTPPDGKPIEHNAHVTAELYGIAKVGDPIPVFYVPSDPENNRLVADEIIDEMRMPPLVNFATPILLVVLSMFLFFEAYLKFHGKGIDRDSKTGKFSIKKYGEGV